jgi:Coenzyme PQQ synthesis protein D (PqqD)
MFSTNSQIRSLVTPEGAMILNIASDQMITLNSMGGYVWARLQEGKSVEEIISNLAKETGHDPAVITNDVHEFVEQLTQRHLVILQRSM